MSFYVIVCLFAVDRRWLVGQNQQVCGEILILLHCLYNRHTLHLFIECSYWIIHAGHITTVCIRFFLFFYWKMELVFLRMFFSLVAKPLIHSVTQKVKSVAQTSQGVYPAWVPEGLCSQLFIITFSSHQAASHKLTSSLKCEFTTVTKKKNYHSWENTFPAFFYI